MNVENYSTPMFTDSVGSSSECLSDNFAPIELADIRTQIDTIDDQILDLLQKRAVLSDQVGQIKKEHEIPVHAGQREKDILRKVGEASVGHLLKPTSAHVIFKAIMSESRKIQGEHPASTPHRTWKKGRGW